MDDVPPIAKTIAFITATASGLVCIFFTIMAFINGGVGEGLLWIFIVDPIAITVCYWISTLIVLPIIYLEKLLRR